MKRITLLLVAILSLPFFSYSGGIVTNQNQSASYVRMFARDASTDIDAVFFNPAGLTKLDDGFYLSLNYQYIKQNKVVTSNYPHLYNTPVDYEGEISVPVFPGLYAAYKTGKFVISLGINPVGGGGGATFSKGLPSFETGISDLVPGLTAKGLTTTAYSLDAYFEGSSAFWGYQLGASYEINDMFSIYLGARYISAKNTYAGHLTDVMVNTITATNPSGAMVSASELFSNLAANATNAATSLQSLTDGGLGDYTLAFAAGLGYLTPVQLATLEAGYTSLGLDPALATISDGIAPFTASAAESGVKSVLLADQEDVEAEQTGTGVTPIIGANISLNDKLNIGIKYEFRTKLELENNTTTDFIVGFDPISGQTVGMFPDGETVRNDIPALLSIGFDYQISEKLSVASGFHMYFDKAADYGKKLDGVHVDNDEIIDNNSTEFALGLQYKMSEKMLFSIGYLHTETGVTEDYQTDLSYSNHSNSFGFGGAYGLTSKIDLNVGVGYTFYNESRKIYSATDALGDSYAVTESYDKDNLFVSVGLDFKFGKKKSE